MTSSFRSSQVQSPVRIATRYIFFALLLAGIAVSLLPASVFPRSVVPFVSEDGGFAEGPTRLTVPGPPGSKTPTSVKIHMHKGVCHMALVREDGRKAWTAQMGKGSFANRCDGQSVLTLDSRGGSGEYHVSFGPKWHPLAPTGRALLLVSCVAALLLVAVMRHRLVPCLRSSDAGIGNSALSASARREEAALGLRICAGASTGLVPAERTTVHYERSRPWKRLHRARLGGAAIGNEAPPQCAIIDPLGRAQW